MSPGYSYNSAWIDGYNNCRKGLVELQAIFMQKMKDNFESSETPEEKLRIDKELLVSFFKQTGQYLTRVPK